MTSRKDLIPDLNFLAGALLDEKTEAALLDCLQEPGANQVRLTMLVETMARAILVLAHRVDALEEKVLR